MSMAKWVIAIFISTLMTMIAIYIIKQGAIKYNVPVIRTVAEGI